MKHSCVLLLCSVIGLSCCTAPETSTVASAAKRAIHNVTDVKTVKELAYYRERLHHDVDVMMKLAAHEAELKAHAFKPDSEKATDSVVWKTCVRDVDSALVFAQDKLNESIEKLRMILTSDPPH